MTPVVELLLADPTIPASSSKSSHGGFPGGLIVHTMHVTTFTMLQVHRFSEALDLFGNEKAPVIQDPALLDEEMKSLNFLSAFKVGVIHDLNKIRGLNGKKYYVPNMIKNGTQQSDAKPWVVNKEASAFVSLKERLAMGPLAASPLLELLETSGITMRDGLASIALAKEVSPTLVLTPAERKAIIFHDGAYAGRGGIQDNEGLLQLCLHNADMIASRFTC